jgi:hypothetical protein
MHEILGFRRFTTPVVIAILFWLGLIFIVDCGFRYRFPRGARAPTFPRNTNRDRDRLDLFRFAFWRVLCEMPMVIFRSYETVAEIKEALKSSAKKGARRWNKKGASAEAPFRF